MYANEVFNNHEDYSGFSILIGAFFFAIQIYCDFSGYSHVAIGTERLFGFTLIRNFAFPYFSRDMAEFWRRWHISLSTWFRDYLYIPLGGSRGNKWMQVRNTMIVFTVSGFWHISKQTKLESVYIGISFNHFNKYNNKNLLTGKIQKNNPTSYILESANFEGAYTIIASQIKGEIIKKGKPNMSREAFWQSQLKDEAKKYYSLYKYPDNYYDKLKKIADYCQKNNVKLTFFSPPTHIDLQNTIAQYNLQKEFEHFKRDIKKLGTWVDFDYPNEFTSNAENFDDPFHLKTSMRYKIITDDLLNEKGKYSVRYTIKEDK